MVDSREKGARAETTVRDALRKATGLNWERVPGSGALDAKHGLKGDLYIPHKANNYCVEVKHYAETQFDTSIFTGKNPMLIEWWKQAVRQGEQLGKKPLLIFKHDRSKLFVAHGELAEETYTYAFINYKEYQLTISLLDDWLKYEKPRFVNENI